MNYLVTKAMTEREAIDILGTWIWKNICYSDFQYCGKAEDISREYGSKLYRHLRRQGITLQKIKDLDDMIIRIAR